MRISQADYDRIIGTVARKSPVACPAVSGKAMNKTEGRYARDVLEPRRLVGEVREYGFQVEGLWLADGLYFYPDFRVITADWRVEFHEVKGGYIREDSWIKFKMAVREHPYPFVLAKWEKKTGWVTELFIREDR